MNKNNNIKKYLIYSFLICLVCLILLSSTSSGAASSGENILQNQFLTQTSFSSENNSVNQSDIYVDFYYSPLCESCKDIKARVIDKLKKDYSENETVVFRYKDIADYPDEFEYYQEEYLMYYPFVAIQNESIERVVAEPKLTIKNLKFLINNFGSNVSLDNIVETPDDNKSSVREFDFLFWHISLDTQDYSLPVLTLVLGIADSFNPCAIFILFFLLNFLLHTNSRKRMLLIAGIFIFFSGLLYALFMFIMYETLVVIRTAQNILIISLVAGLVVLPFGILNIKDFFFFKKGVSLSIPEDKKPKLFKQVRKIVKNPALGATILATIILALTVNFYELLCTLGLPLAFTSRLAAANITQGSGSYYIYILFYNIVYVIPLIVIVLIFVFTLNRINLTEWHGRILKLLSGVMLSSFGVILLFQHELLGNFLVPIFLLLLSIAVTAAVTTIWKKFKPELT
ncbi:MAG: hypothetical protein V5A64_03485 [Candidatus Thermoplasmatota archaeon]